MKRTIILPMIVVSKLWLVAAVAAADSYQVGKGTSWYDDVRIASETS